MSSCLKVAPVRVKRGALDQHDGVVPALGVGQLDAVPDAQGAATLGGAHRGWEGHARQSTGLFQGREDVN